MIFGLGNYIYPQSYIGLWQVGLRVSSVDREVVPKMLGYVAFRCGG